ncbi:MAG: xylose isomerase, partial [Burkholderiales bacterium]
ELKAEGHWGRACQYPFKKPRPGEWVHSWNAYRVEPTKEVVRRVLRRHRDTPGSPLKWITTDMIDMADYGGGVGYSLIEQNIAIAQWIRKTWAEIEAEPKVPR